MITDREVLASNGPGNLSSAQHAIAQRLRQIFAAVPAEPIPDRMAVLLRELERHSGTPARSSDRT